MVDFLLMGDVVMTLAKILFFIVALLMILAILLQEGKGGGLAALGGTRAEGVISGPTNPIRRATVVLAVLFLLLASFITWNQARGLDAAGVVDEPGEGPAATGARDGDGAQDAQPGSETTHTPPATETEGEAQDTDATDADAANEGDAPADDVTPAEGEDEADAADGDAEADPADGE
jgi:protein translocase SecG subunit